MADYIAQTRSNYFKVKDEQSFREFCLQYSLEVIEQKSEEESNVTLFGFMLDGSIPTGLLVECEWVDADFLKDLSDELAFGQVAVVMEVGTEKMRYLNGYAVAVNHRGRIVEVSLNQIYLLAKKKFKVEPTTAEY